MTDARTIRGTNAQDMPGSNAAYSACGGKEHNYEDNIHGCGKHGFCPQHHRGLHVRRVAQGFRVRALRHRWQKASGEHRYPHPHGGDHGRSRKDHVISGSGEPKGSSAGRQLRGERDTGRRIRAMHRDRFRDPEKIRHPPDHRRHSRDRGNNAHSPHDTGCGGLLPRHDRGLSGRVVPQLCQPHGYDNRIHAALRFPEHSRPLPLGTGLFPCAALRMRHGRQDRRQQLQDRRYQPHGLAA